MRGTDRDPPSKNIEPDFGLCSHLVRLSFPDGDLRPQTVSLEEIRVEGAGLAVERARVWPWRPPTRSA